MSDPLCRLFYGSRRLQDVGHPWHSNEPFVLCDGRGVLGTAGARCWPSHSRQQEHGRERGRMWVLGRLWIGTPTVSRRTVHRYQLRRPRPRWTLGRRLGWTPSHRWQLLHQLFQVPCLAGLQCSMTLWCCSLCGQCPGLSLVLFASVVVKAAGPSRHGLEMLATPSCFLSPDLDDDSKVSQTGRADVFDARHTGIKLGDWSLERPLGTAPSQPDERWTSDIGVRSNATRPCSVCSEPPRVGNLRRKGGAVPSSHCHRLLIDVLEVVK